MMSLAWNLYRGYEAEDRLGRAIEWVLIALLAFMPLAFGAVQAWSEQVVIVLAVVVILCFCVRLALRRSQGFVWTWAYVPVAAFILLAAGQLLPLPLWAIRLISSNTALQKTDLLKDLGGVDAHLHAMTISFYPHMTEHDLRLVLAVAGVFVVVVNTFRRPDQIRRLLLAVTVIGAVVALVALGQDVLGNGMIYWCVPSPHGTSLSGPFVNHSHYAQFMNLSMGAALGLLCMEVHEAFRRSRVTAAAVADYLGSSDGRLVWGLAAVIVLGTATVFASLSRGGIVSLMIAGAFTVLVLGSRKSLPGSGWVVVLLALGAFICVLYIGFDAVYDRLGTLSDLNRAEGGRWRIVRDVAVAWTRFPMVGTGLGTHEVVYPMFDRSTAVTLASHAENEYAQAAEETGAIGFIALLTIGIMAWRGYVRTLRTAEAPVHSAAYGLGFGLLAILTHSLSDFGQHVPANAFLTAIFCALLIRLPHIGRMNDVPENLGASMDAHAVRYDWVLPIVVCLVSAWAVMRADQARRGEAAWAQARETERVLMGRERKWQGSDEEYIDLLTHAVAAQRYEPDNIQYRYWLSVYRWRAISRLVDPNTGEVVLTPPELEFAYRVVDELKQAIPVCPVYGPAWSVLGQLERSVCGRKQEGARHIWRGRELAPCDSETCYVAGMMLAEEGDVDAACEQWRRAAQLDGGLFDEIALRLVQQFDRADLALSIAGDNVHWLGKVAKILDQSARDTELVRNVRGRLVALLEEKCRSSMVPPETLAWLASIYSQEGRIPDAIEYYRRALRQNYNEVGWHYNLALLFEQAGKFREAMQEARLCLRSRSDDPAVHRLIDRLKKGSGLPGQTGPTP